MRFSRSLEQAFCILVILAEGGSIITNSELNHILKVSPTYLKKITRKLVVKKLIKSTYGVNGGFVLAQPAEMITIGNVVEAIDGNTHFFYQSGLLKRVAARHGRIKNNLSIINDTFCKAEADWRKRLHSVTLAHMVSDLRKRRQEC